MSEITHSVLFYQTWSSALYMEVTAYMTAWINSVRQVFLFSLTYFGHLPLPSVGTFISLHQMI